MPNKPKTTVSHVTMAKQIYYNHTLILTYSITYPEFSSEQYERVMPRMNAFYRKKGQDYINYVQNVLKRAAITDYKNSIKNGYPVHVYEVVQEFKVTENQNCLLSLYTDQYEYTGGAHGNTVRFSDTWLLTRGIRLPLKAFFPGNRHYEAELKKEINKQIKEQLEVEEGKYFENYKELVEETFSPKQYFLTPKAIAIYFQQYDIAPYVTGIPVFEIPYRKVNAKLPGCTYNAMQSIME